MQFKHPEILYALIALIIPVIVHLFQLQKFVKISFTNVKFLKNIEKQTRKSARLKKWLILCTRLLAFACLIFAFAQPYFSTFSEQQNFKTTIYLDNSFSMQAKGEEGELLKSAAQKIIENTTQRNTEIAIFTNDRNLNNIDVKSLKNELINLKYHPISSDLNTVFLKLNRSKDDKINTLNKDVLISDFQVVNFENKTDFTNVNSSTTMINLSPKKAINFFVDSVYISKRNSLETTLKVVVKSTEDNSSGVPVSLYNESKLIGKTTSQFSNSNRVEVQFTISDPTDFKGKIALTDDHLEFDNDFYFVISKPDKINVLSIGNYSEFLTRIYTKTEFNFSTAQLQNLNYNIIRNQHLIILNEVESIPVELINSLDEFVTNGGQIVVIPAINSHIDSYNRLFGKLNLGNLKNRIEGEHKITSINYNHPLLADVFEKRVDNFQYPKSTLHYETGLINSTSVIKYDNDRAFISSINTGGSTIYWVSSPLNKNISDFYQSSLVVPVFYNFAKNSLKITELFYFIAPETIVEVPLTLEKDHVLKIRHVEAEFIPLQNISQNKVTLIIQGQIEKSGFYSVTLNDQTVKSIAFNYDRNESNLTYLPIETLVSGNENITVSSTIDTFLDEIGGQQKINWLFKWFLAFSVLFLLIEMLILKYFNI